jgi:molybdopterin/thiamine biosynthesis adenylyltransferase
VLGAVPGVIGTLQAAEAVKLLAGVGTPLRGRPLRVARAKPQREARSSIARGRA